MNGIIFYSLALFSVFSWYRKEWRPELGIVFIDAGGLIPGRRVYISDTQYMDIVIGRFILTLRKF